ncbi:MAG TPA: lycopene cyclase domain-containing protein [Actinomycetes bacterium]|nr:lycopene cyclase domain-containing protein [Actinomycetes bacterium]
MRHLSYAAVLAFCVVGTLPLELWLGVRVYRQWKRLLLTLLPVVAVFVVWDLYAISAGHWTFDEEQTTGVLLPGDLPLDELLFFVVVPTCALLSVEAVRKVRGWPLGDE